jgi:hypothetical protein
VIPFLTDTDNWHRQLLEIGRVLPFREFLPLVDHVTTGDENPLTPVVECSRIFRRAGHMGLQDFQNEEIVKLYQTGIGNPAFQICEAFPDQRRGYLLPRHRSQAKLSEFIDYVPRAISDAYYFVNQVRGWNIDYAFPALPDHLKTDIVLGNHASEQCRGKLDDGVPTHRHDIIFAFPGRTNQDDWTRFQQPPDIGNGKILFCITLHAHTSGALLMKAILFLKGSCFITGIEMNDLLQLALVAHGGLDRWKKVKAIKVAASITGAIWHVKGKGNFLKNVVLTAETWNERLTVDFPGQDKRAIFEPDRVVIETEDRTLIEARDNPEKSFEGHQRETPWDDIHVAYFVGEALWTYLNTPFLYADEGFVTEEIASIRVENETWRRLKVTFPDKVKSHTREQISCFGPDGLLRRHDYTVDILGGATGLNYASEYRDVDGIIVPTKRRVYAYEGDYQLVQEPLLVAIDMGEITLL